MGELNEKRRRRTSTVTPMALGMVSSFFIPYASIRSSIVMRIMEYNEASVFVYSIRSETFIRREKKMVFICLCLCGGA